MAYKTGDWGEEAKTRYEKRKDSGYFREYARRRRAVAAEKRRLSGAKPHSGKYGLSVGNDRLDYQRRLRRIKKQSFQELKDKCSVCGYDKCKWALHFHHVDASTKSFGLAIARDLPLEKLQEEIAKCVILCANCHAEEEFSRSLEL